MASQISRRRLRRGERGASAVEFALIIPLLVMLLLGTITAGLVYADHVSLTNAAREGARYGAAADAASTSWASSVQTRVQQVYFNAAGTAPTNAQVCVRLITSTGAVSRVGPRHELRHGAGSPHEHGHRDLCGARVDGEAGTHPARRRPRPPHHPERPIRVVLRPDGRHDMHRRLMLRARAARGDERGAVAIIVAVGMTALCVVVRHGARLRARARGPPDRQLGGRRSDPRGLHGLLSRGDGNPHPYAGVCTAVRYLKANHPRFDGITENQGWTDGLNAPTGNGCSSVALRNKVCSKTNKATWAKWTWSGTYRASP